MAGGAKKRSKASGATPERSKEKRATERPSRGGPRLSTVLLITGSLTVLYGLSDSIPWRRLWPAPPGPAKDGGGCWPLNQHDLPWLATAPGRALNFSALPPEASVFVCYDGRAAGHAERGYADTAVVLVEDFLTASEVGYFRELVKTHAQPAGQPGYLFANGVGAQYAEEARSEFGVDLSDDVRLARVEARIAAFVGIDAHGEESPLQLAHDIAQPGGPAPGVPNIHHDKNHGLVRHVTSLTYLSTPEEGGETLFPALPAPAGGPRARSPELDGYATELAEIVARQIVDNEELRRTGEWPAVQVEEGSDLHARLTRLCPAEAARSDNPRTRDVLPMAVQPVAGRSVFFWHEAVFHGASTHAEPLLDVFHGGCPVRRGEKLALQKFKNYAPGSAGCKASPLCAKYF